MATAIADIEIIPLSKACGAEIRGVDLSKPLAGRTLKAIEKAWYENLLIVFRGQEISNDDQVRFCRYFGELEEVRTGKFANEEMRHTMMITNVTDTGFQTALEDGDMWFHSDQCYYEVPCRASTLYAMEIPKNGGNTLFANCYTAWETLPDKIRERLDGLKARNIYDYAGNPLKRGDNIDPNAPQFIHPIARTHPETGRKALYVNRLMTDLIEGLKKEESDEILELLFKHSEDTEFVYEHVWRVGDLVMWDNRCSMHARTYFDPGERRMMRRVTVKGEKVR
ncbi:MAG: Pentalenolactone F synthase [Alphaproteobacteria bacterium MarineAlpha11_Bin1]|nr:MAG: Pentalenolactone F synthase [Alphaproteobacteria bacterium MarineAlpha11_Bin1]|tara:strand:- start:4353 stop:5195 length:843 start_codon:yes stop_codon:yes gene_type:complete